MKRAFSAIQPTNMIHIGNYIGAMGQFVEMQKTHDAIFCIVDYHAITVPQDPQVLRKNIMSMAAMYIACGINPKKAVLFQQSRVSEHTELCWILNCVARTGELERMTQFKDKTKGKGESVSVGLFDYPVLMAADILLYGTDIVPIGDDQKQHVELARDLAIRFNRDFGKIFTVPEPRLKKEGARIMGLDDPNVKMSKSALSPKNYISMTDEDSVIEKKIMSAVTDSGSAITDDSTHPAIKNLLTIMSEVTGKSRGEIVRSYEGKGYGEFKKDLARAIIEFVRPIRERHNELMNNPKKLQKILDKGAVVAKKIAERKMKEVRIAIGVDI